MTRSKPRDCFRNRSLESHCGHVIKNDRSRPFSSFILATERPRAELISGSSRRFCDNIHIDQLRISGRRLFLIPIWRPRFPK